MYVTTFVFFSEFSQFAIISKSKCIEDVFYEEIIHKL